MPLDDARIRLVSQWVRKAEDDFQVVQLLRTESERLGGAIAFHAQQCVEKYLKAVLTDRQQEFPKTHDIEHLRVLVAMHDGTLAEKLRDAAILSWYAVDARYPGEDDPPSVENVLEVLKLMDGVRTACRATLDARQLDTPGNH